jgi:hypothetical protein
MSQRYSDVPYDNFQKEDNFSLPSELTGNQAYVYIYRPNSKFRKYDGDRKFVNNKSEIVPYSQVVDTVSKFEKKKMVVQSVINELTQLVVVPTSTPAQLKSLRASLNRSFKGGHKTNFHFIEYYRLMGELWPMVSMTSERTPKPTKYTSNSEKDRQFLNLPDFASRAKVKKTGSKKKRSKKPSKKSKKTAAKGKKKTSKKKTGSRRKLSPQLRYWNKLATKYIRQNGGGRGKNFVLLPKKNTAAYRKLISQVREKYPDFGKNKKSRKRTKKNRKSTKSSKKKT